MSSAERRDLSDQDAPTAPRESNRLPNVIFEAAGGAFIDQ